MNKKEWTNESKEGKKGNECLICVHGALQFEWGTKEYGMVVCRNKHTHTHIRTHNAIQQANQHRLNILCNFCWTNDTLAHTHIHPMVFALDVKPTKVKCSAYWRMVWIVYALGTSACISDSFKWKIKDKGSSLYVCCRSVCVLCKWMFVSFSTVIKTPSSLYYICVCGYAFKKQNNIMSLAKATLKLLGM